MIIIGCSGAINLAKNIANNLFISLRNKKLNQKELRFSLREKVVKRLNCSYQTLFMNKFPDGELYVRFLKEVSKEELILVQSFYGNINDKLVELIFAAQTAKDLGAKNITLVAPYFSYLRQDKRFKPGEAISIEIVAKLLKACIDKIIILDPHLHRKKALSDIFKFSAVKLSAYPLIAGYIRKNIKNPIIIGPDEESYKWAQTTAEAINCEYAILKKKRFTARHVKITLNKKINLDNKNVVIVDDIISTGHTILETIKNLKKIGAKNITCICVHGIFIENALEKIRKAGAKVISCNTIPNKVAGIDVSGLVAGELRNA